MTTKSDKIILELIRKALDKGHHVDEALFSAVNWTEVMDIATVQGVLGICFDGIELTLSTSHLRGEGMGLSKENLMSWFGQVRYMEACHEKYMKTINDLSQFYREQGIKMLLLKGYGLSLYWPVPDHRPVGDIDVYLGQQWELGDRMVHEQLGIEVENGHEHHTCFLYKGTMVENHYDFINTKAHRDAQHIEDKLKELATRGCQESLIGSNGTEVYLPSPDFNAIFLIRHLGQHFAGERVTLRQLLDWGLFLKAEGSKVNWTKIIPFLKEIGIWTFFNQINAICEDYLGIELTEYIPAIERNTHLETRIIEDVLHPEFAEEKPKKLMPVLWFKLKRWWYNRWKHPLVYNEWLLPMFLTLMWSHIKRYETIKQ